MKAQLSKDSESRKRANKNMVGERESQIKSILENNNKRSRRKKQDGVRARCGTGGCYRKALLPVFLSPGRFRTLLSKTPIRGLLQGAPRDQVGSLELRTQLFLVKEGSKMQNGSLENNTGVPFMRKPKTTLPAARACSESMKIWIGDSFSP